MGCGSSKPEDGGDSAAGDRAICRRFGEIRRLRLSGGRSRKDSTVRLLNPEEGEDAVTAAMEEASTGGTLHSSSGFCSACGACCVPPMENNLGTQPPSTATVMTPPPVVDVVRPRVEKAAAVAADSPPEKNEAESGREGEKKQMKVNPRITEEAEKMDAEEGKREKNRLEEAEDITEDDKEAAALVCSAGALLTYDEGELPGSPSFRVYFVGSARQAVDDEPLDPNTASLGKKGESSTGSRNSMDSSSTGRMNSLDSRNSEEREAKTSTRSKGSRFRALTRRHSAVHGFLNVRSCYSHRQSDASDCRENSCS